MLKWLAENIGTIVTAAAVLAVAGAIAVSMVVKRKKGGSLCSSCSSCGGGCSGCPMCGSCGAARKDGGPEDGTEKKTSVRD